MPGARIKTPEIVIEIDDEETFLLTGELYSIDRPNAPFDAAQAADLLQTPSAQPVEFTDTQAHAVLRALGNLRSANRMNKRRELMRAGRALDGYHPRGQAISYNLVLGDQAKDRRWESYSGPYEAGDRLTVPEGDWRVVDRDDGATPPKLFCEPFVVPE
jgi:hypothetical protein